MHTILLPVGSAGDFHPFIAIGEILKQRGHRVTLVGNDHFLSTIQRADLEYVSVGTEQEYLDAIQDEELWHPRRGLQKVARYTETIVRRQFEAIHSLAVPGECVLVAPLLGFGGRLAQEKLGLPLVTVHLQPALIFSLARPAVHPGAWIKPYRLPRFIWRTIFGCVERSIINPLFDPAVNAVRREIGLPPIQYAFTRWGNSPTRIIGLFPEWFASPAADWPTSLVQLSFPLFDGRENTDLPSAVRQFLDAGEPPVVFTFGSAMRVGRKYFSVAAEACRRLGCRGILIAREASQIPAALPPGVVHFEYVPFGQLFARAAVVVHHGGIGTTAQALAAGVPQLVMPMSHDQPDNADRLEILGVGRTLTPFWFTAGRLTKMLRKLLADHHLREQAKKWADRLRADPPLDAACHWIERTYEEQTCLAGKS